MKLANVFIIFRKEFLDVLRDRRTIVSMVLLPILIIPIMTLGLGTFMSSQIKKLEKAQSPVVVIGGQWAPELMALLEEKAGLQIIPSIQDTATVLQMLQEKSIHAALVIPEGFEGLLSADRAPVDSLRLRLLFDKSKTESEMVMARMKSLLQDYREQQIRRQLEIRSLPVSVIEPFYIATENRATEAQMAGAVMGMLLPYLVILLAMTGCTYPAIDLTAGEKERGTLETLLVSPASRLELVLGKFLTTMLAGFITASLTLTSMLVTFAMGARMGSDTDLEGMAFSLDPLALITIFLLFVPVAALFASTLIAIAVNARSYKEAQSYVYPLMFLVIIPAMTSMVPGIEVDLRMAFIPVVNVALILRNALMGSYDFALIALTFLSSTLYAAAGVFTAVRVFQKETVLLRT
ncbi:MAG: ABC transporter permease [Candidatus Zixiibacteriota bacterium]|nr:MAG: ABC transporter permease [candidate division Zixibacteria bacterium]